MKKNLMCFLVFLFVSVFALSAQQKYLDCINNGDYIYFMDYRYNSPYIKGYLVYHFDDTSSFIISTTTDAITDEKGYIIFTTRLDENDSISIQEIYAISAKTEEEEDFYIQNAIDFLNFAAMRLSIKDEIKEDSTFEDKWDNYSLWYHFSSVIPFFGFDTICYDKEGTKVAMEAYRYGHYKEYSNELLDAFVANDIKYVEPVERNSGSVPSKAKKKTVKDNGYKITLDENWTENTYGKNISYWLEIQSYRESQIMIEPAEGVVSLATKEEKISFARLLLQLISGVIPTSINAYFDKNDLIIEYDIIDEEKWLTYTRIRITDKYLINFSSFKDVYEANKPYFEKILKSIKKTF